MRYWEPPGGTRADLIVSELFGSFGDNELSPEALDGAQRLLKGIRFIVVPCARYTRLICLLSILLVDTLNII